MNKINIDIETIATSNERNVSNVSATMHPSGVISVKFDTVEKYIKSIDLFDIDEWDTHNKIEMIVWGSDSDAGGDIINFQIPNNKGYNITSPIIVPLKFSYIVSIVPWDLIIHK